MQRPIIYKSELEYFNFIIFIILAFIIRIKTIVFQKVIKKKKKCQDIWEERKNMAFYLQFQRKKQFAHKIDNPLEIHSFFS